MTAHDLGWVQARPARRRRALVLLTLVLTVLIGAPASATEETATAAPGGEEEQVTFEELQRNSSQRAQEFFPEEYVEPSFFQWISIPVLIAGLVIAILLLFAYLWWQPKFAAERRQRQRR